MRCAWSDTFRGEATDEGALFMPSGIHECRAPQESIQLVWSPFVSLRAATAVRTCSFTPDAITKGPAALRRSDAQTCGVYEPDSGFLAARRACEAVFDASDWLLFADWPMKLPI
jgi:hypothetical protein